MKNLYVVHGGLGKNILFTSLIPSLCKKDGVEKISVMTPWPFIFRYNKQIDGVEPFDRQFGWKLHPHLTKYDNIIYHEPYYSNYIIDENIHMVDDWAQGLDIEPVINKPYVPIMNIDHGHTFYSISPDETCDPPEKKYCVVQVNGGYGQQGNNIIIPRDYRLDLVQKLISKIRKEFNLDVICFRLQTEPKPSDTITFKANTEDGLLNILPIIEDSEFVISIDSSLKHLAACTDTKTIALYNKIETRPEKIGYSFQTNLICENDICIDIDPVDILETIRKECYG